MTKNSYTRSCFDHYAYYKNLKDRSFDYMLLYFNDNVNSIKEQVGDRGVEDTTEKWIWDERS